MYQGFVSINSVIDRLYRHPMMTDLPYESAIVWAVDVIRLIGSPTFLQAKIARLNVENHRTTRPADLIFMRSARRVKRPFQRPSTWTFMNTNIYDVNTAYDQPYPEPQTPPVGPLSANNIVQDPQTIGEEYEQMFEATDPFHEFYNYTDTRAPEMEPHNTYKFSGNYIYTSFSDGTIDIAYDGIMLDNDGYPMIPNDPTVEMAIENNIKRQYFGILSDLGKDTVRALERAEREYCWYIGQSQSHAALLSIDGRESLSNTMNRLMLNDKWHRTSYRNLSHPEEYRKQ